MPFNQELKMNPSINSTYQLKKSLKKLFCVSGFANSIPNKHLLVSMIVLLVGVFSSYAAVTVSNTSVNTISNANTLTFFHTTSAGAYRMLMVGFSAQQPAGLITSLSYNGQNLTKLNSAANSSQSRVEIWYLINPPVGTFPVVVNTNLVDNAVIGVQSYTGVNPTTPFGTFASASGISTTATVNASSAVGELVYGVVAFNNGSTNLAVGAGQAEYWDGTVNSSIAGAGSTETGAASVTISWTSTAQPWTIAAVSLKPAPTFAPGGVINNHTLWLKADAGTSSTTDGATVTTWTNSASGAEVSTAAAGQQPIYRRTSANFNYNPLLDFDGVNDVFAGTSNFGVAGTNLFTSFVVFRKQDNTSSGTLYNASPGGTNAFGYWVSGTSPYNQSVSVWAGNVGGIIGTNTNNRAGVGLLTGYNRSASNTWTLYNNGLNDGTGSMSSFAGTFTSANLNFGLGGGYSFGGDIAEIVIHQSSLTNTDINKIQSYLGLKYGITLGSTASPFTYIASDGTTTFWAGNATYQNNVAGIARDDASALNQKQSQSVNSGLQVAIGNGNTIATDNISNTNSFSVDKSALVWGDNGASVAAWTTTGAPTARQILPRTWKVQETGTVGSVKVRVPDNTGVNGLPVELTAVYLLDVFPK